jgi:uncharacterized membrane protein
MEQISEWIELVALGVEILAVGIMATIIFIGTICWVVRSAKNVERAYGRYRLVLGKTLLIGLELLVAADIIRTVALDATPISLGLLGGLVVIRTFLGWSIIVELEGRWPWQKGTDSESVTGEKATTKVVS